MPQEIIRAEEWLGKIKGRLEEHKEAIEKAAYETALQGCEHAVVLTTKQDLLNYGHYRLGWSYRKTASGWAFGNSVPYASVIEYGRRPMRPGPPIEPILEWVKRKLVAKGEVPPKEAKSVAFLIRRKIHVKGSKPRHILRTVTKQMRRFFVKEIKRRFKKLSRPKMTG